MKYRILLTTAIYQHIQAMSYSQLQLVSFGNIITIITSGLFKFDEVFNFMLYLIVTPIGVIIIVTIAYIEIGWPSIIILFGFVIHFRKWYGVNGSNCTNGK